MRFDLSFEHVRSSEVAPMIVVAGVVAVLLFVYLVVAMVRPERF
jgi:K+-transporting ATPase KdpF subunit